MPEMDYRYPPRILYDDEYDSIRKSRDKLLELTKAREEADREHDKLLVRLYGSKVPGNFRIDVVECLGGNGYQAILVPTLIYTSNKLTTTQHRNVPTASEALEFDKSVDKYINTQESKGEG